MIDTPHRGREWSLKCILYDKAEKKHCLMSKCVSEYFYPVRVLQYFSFIWKLKILLSNSHSNSFIENVSVKNKY